jgi:metal-responsive CopG/Arc/MetJ family transcriptional regulator
MPYIRDFERKWIERSPGVIHARSIENSGELNYAITRLVQEYLRQHSKNYLTMNEIVGVLEQVKDEFQRRVVHPYEDVKMQENGDVYD